MDNLIPFIAIWMLVIFASISFEFISLIDGQNPLNGEAFRFAILFPLYAVFWVPYASIYCLVMFGSFLWDGIKTIHHGSIFAKNK